MTTLHSNNRQIMLKLLIAAVMMFGFGYALVPMYQALCKVTGINVLTSKNDYGVRAISPNRIGNTQVDYSRKVTIEFDSNSRGPFTFKPVKNFLEVHPGEMTEIVYEVTNNLGRTVEAQAIPSYAPKSATEFFTKLECFCFQQQTLAPYEMKRMPVVFVIDAGLPEDVKTITLSYTFFEIGVGQQPAGSTTPKT
ncbi:cytochrome c oxidase assembly protein [Polynucleobacter asymbioticus]|jgi:cytochrome c oxidase assembly protein subunit 11|uniref:Cytochrome c oxidase assembly protein CtaG n=2 Tax=Polynucleobacter asymbioticus TaxID=576611 RepID=A4T086_POLAQ|nr:cytochrome c oxidase assembly protein [Polynucleobacter asymbioticus]ABP35150.1 cytochrome c oxidase assembly protein CtaG/Cox11 [Polynucleobacter asymbioticus QLW-P1DMWA-1]APB99808.1 cytochrome C oxidase assembly protein [Polynucleobacter asymbioticus]APC02105.1 cytochrome C oxidase assembly protein [Polynucleobacter asymbioticus]APC06915.1 cytochrome C oxidase assembly protein [Polynucleobacter asymbioticus]